MKPPAATTAAGAAATPAVAWEVRISPIHGHGLFATRPISAGERILEYKGTRIPKPTAPTTPTTPPPPPTAPSPAPSSTAPSSTSSTTSTLSTPSTPRIYTFSLDSHYSLDGDIPDNPAKHANHSCDENCDAILLDGHLWLYAARDIAAGEELTLDYAFPLETFFEHPCRCGSPRCVRYIIARPDRPKLRRLLARSRRSKPRPQAHH